MDWNPANAWDKHAEYLRGLPSAIGQKPKSMLVVSGHWEEENVTVQSNDAPDLLFDYNGFPPHTYELTYPAPGNRELSAKVISLLDQAGIATGTNSERGYDHGVFVPLKVAFPDADIPIVQLSLLSSLDPTAHIAIGEALRPLRQEGVLIVGSGNTYHNMGTFSKAMRNGGHETLVGKEFDDWLTLAVCNADPHERNKMLNDWADAPGGRDAHPREEHLIPLHVVAGAAGGDTGKKTLEDHVMGAVLSAFQFG